MESITGSIPPRAAVPLARRAAQAAKAAGMLRLVILRLLIAGREASAGALVERAGLSRQARSRHLARPWEDGLVATRRTGTTIRYGIADPRVARIIATLHDAFCLPAP